VGARRRTSVAGGQYGCAPRRALHAEPLGVDLSSEAIAFCQQAHRDLRVDFKVGDAENLPVEDHAFNQIVNVESSHTYPNLRAFLAEVRRALRPGGLFLHTEHGSIVYYAQRENEEGSIRR
jgi:ubiquinone/menaquinone biosynthesis C-methylase UbiE